MTLHPHSKRLQDRGTRYAAVDCVDRRITDDDADRAAIRAVFGSRRVEFFPFAGGAGVMVTLADLTKGKEFAKFSLGVGIHSHGAEQLLLTTHTDCAAFAAAGYKFTSAEVERAFHREELRKAKSQVLAWYPDVKVMLGFMTVDREDKVVIEPVD